MTTQKRPTEKERAALDLAYKILKTLHAGTDDCSTPEYHADLAYYELTDYLASLDEEAELWQLKAMLDASIPEAKP